MVTRAKPKANIATASSSRRVTRRGVLMALLMTRLPSVSFHFRWCLEGVVRRRRRHRPLQSFGAIPGFCRGGLAAANALDDDEQEQQLGDAEHEGAHR